ncbi:MAG: protein translocase SEC61 complex subunit gamma [Candidatus Micrarchaeota archaeon]
MDEAADEPKGMAGLRHKLDIFIKQSERVLNVTHKPDMVEFRQIATSTAIGMVIIGVIGFAISMVAYFIRGH